jgi:hypothetical protein
MRILLITALAVFAVGCSEPASPARPSNVPATAQWYGGADGGAWIDVSPAGSDSLFDLTIYTAHTGEVWTYCELSTFSRCRLTENDIRESITAFDGSRILFDERLPADCIAMQKMVP